MLGRIKGALAPLGGCAALEPPCALQSVAITGKGRTSHFVRPSLGADHLVLRGPRFGARQTPFYMWSNSGERRGFFPGMRASLVSREEDTVYPMVPAGADLHAMIRRPSPIVETAD